MQRKVTDGLWVKLGTQRRNFQGLLKGRNHQATLAWGRQIKEDRTKAFLDTIMTDAVYTPTGRTSDGERRDTARSASTPKETGGTMSMTAPGSPTRRSAQRTFRTV